MQAEPASLQYCRKDIGVEKAGKCHIRKGGSRIVEDEEQRNVLSDNNLRLMRIREQPIHSDESLLVVDQLERGFLRLYEYTGGSIYISEEDAEMIGGTNAVMVAELTVSLRPGKKEVKIDRIFNEFGYELGDLMKNQLLHFADFYGYTIVILDLSKEKPR